MNIDILKKTSLFSQHQKLQAKMTSFAGWHIPLFYSSIMKEYNHCRQKAVVFDVSHMGELVFQGNIETSGLEDAVTCSLAKIPIGRARYGLILNDRGGVIDDFIVLRQKKDKLLFVVNAASLSLDYEILKGKLKTGSLKDKSSQIAKIDLQGPLARKVLLDLFDLGQDLSYFNFSEYNVRGEKILIIRTGYTGELGYEIFLPNQLAASVWENFLAHEDVEPAGFGVRDILRLEMGYNLLGAELKENITPLEAGLEKFVKFEKKFTGKNALLIQKAEGVSKKRIAFFSASKKIPRSGDKIYLAEKELGYVTSGTFSFSLSVGIGLGYVKPGLDKDASIEIEDSRRLRFKAQVTELPFYRKGSLRS